MPLDIVTRPVGFEENLNAIINADSLKIPAIFNLIQETGKISIEEMFSVEFSSKILAAVFEPALYT